MSVTAIGVSVQSFPDGLIVVRAEICDDHTGARRLEVVEDRTLAGCKAQLQEIVVRDQRAVVQTTLEANVVGQVLATAGGADAG